MRILRLLLLHLRDQLAVDFLGAAVGVAVGHSRRIIGEYGPRLEQVELQHEVDHRADEQVGRGEAIAGNVGLAGERADYYRWIFFTSGPIEAAFSNKAAGWEPTPERQRMFGYGNYDLAIGTLEKALTGREYLAGDRFTAADLFVGANVNFMLQFNLLEPRPVFTDYAARMTDRDAYRRAKVIDGKLIAEMQARQAQQQAQPA